MWLTDERPPNETGSRLSRLLSIQGVLQDRHYAKEGAEHGWAGMLRCSELVHPIIPFSSIYKVGCLKIVRVRAHLVSATVAHHVFAPLGSHAITLTRQNDVGLR